MKAYTSERKLTQEYMNVLSELHWAIQKQKTAVASGCLALSADLAGEKAAGKTIDRLDALRELLVRYYNLRKQARLEREACERAGARDSGAS